MEGTRAVVLRQRPRCDIARARLAPERGSIVPFILGCCLLAMVLVAGAVAAGDAFVQQADLQSVCDSAAVAGANAVDLPDARNVSADTLSLPLGDVQAAVEAYLARDAGRADVQVLAQIEPDGRGVDLSCQLRQSITFGVMFGLGHGVTHRTASSARAPVD